MIEQEKNIKVFLQKERTKEIEYYNSIDEKEYKRIEGLLKKRGIANFKNEDNEFYVATNNITYFDLIEEWV